MMRTWRSLAVAVGLVAQAAACSTEPSAPGGFIVGQVLLQDAQVTATRVRYRSGELSVAGLVCRPAAGGRHPLLMINHGGWTGLGGEWDPASSVCVAWARNGYVVIEPSYRGEDGSGGAIELCLGEAADIRSMLRLAEADAEVDSTRVAVLGGSHGGCSSLRALIDGAGPARVVAVAGPTDWAGAYRAFVDSIAAGATGDRLAAFESLASALRQYIGGTPDQVPAAYADRGLVSRVAGLDRWGGDLLVQHGVNDEIVPVEQSCALVAAASGFLAFHVDPTGQVVTTAPAKCEGLGITWLPGPLPGSWSGRRYFVVYDDYGHGTGANTSRVLLDAVQFLRLAAPAADRTDPSSR
jgi:acetyl esterase/lipase